MLTLKLTLKIIGPYESDPLEVWYQPKDIPSDPTQYEVFFKDYLWSEFCEEVSDYFNYQFDDYSELFSTVMLEPKARYSLEESSKIYRKLALDKAREYAQKCRVIYFFTDDEQTKELYRAEFDLKSYLEDVVNSREDDCQSSIDVGEAMIRSMEKYVSSASWHYDWISEGDEKKPTMWFGLDGEKPEEGWLLNIETDPETGNDWKSFWLCYDSWEDWQNRVPDADSIFLTWMTAECGISLPPLEDVLKTCPIEVDEQDDYETLTRKITGLPQERDKKDP